MRIHAPGFGGAALHADPADSRQQAQQGRSGLGQPVGVTAGACSSSDPGGCAFCPRCPGAADPGFDGTVLADATEAIWEERIKGVRNAYKDSCSRLVGALEELEQTLCNLTGDKYQHDEPLLRAKRSSTPP